MDTFEISEIDETMEESDTMVEDSNNTNDDFFNIAMEPTKEEVKNKSTDEATPEEVSEINLSAEEFDLFYRCLSVFKELCNDIDIRGGIIRQRSNDQSFIFEMDLRPIIRESNIALSDIKQKLDLLKTFSNREVKITLSDTNFKFSDNYSGIKFKLASLQFLDNKFIDETELENVFVFSEEKMIIDYDIPHIISDRIKIVSQSFDVQSVQIEFNEDNALIRSASQAKDQTATFVKDLPTNVSLEKSVSHMSAQQFIIDHDDELNIKMFLKDKENITLNKIVTAIEDIDITLFSLSAILAIEED